MMPDQVPSIDCDVTVIGCGLAGKAAALHLARAGLKVVCIEPQQAVRPPVGESLDWSAPDLLHRLGLSSESLIASRIATWKRHVTVKMSDGCEAHYVPSAWLGGPPFHVNLATLHVERAQLDDALLKIVVDEGVTFVRDRVVDLETANQKDSLGANRRWRPRFRSLADRCFRDRELRWWRENSTCLRCSMVPRKWRYGPTSECRSKLKERPSIWTRCRRNIWSGFGKFRSALTQ